MINFKCQCGKSYSVNDNMAGRTGPCQQCGQAITVPLPNPPEEHPFSVPVPPVQQTPPTPKQLFCTNCGNPISEQAVACMSCGARPTGHIKFCRQCGVGLNPEQVVCIKCGAGLTTTSGRSSVYSNISPQAKTINIYFTVFWICAVAGIVLMVPYFLVMFGVARAAIAEEITFDEKAASIAERLIPFLMLFIFGGIGLIAAIIACCMLHYQVWKLIPNDIARTTPGKAVGFLFIPLFNFYWFFVSYLGLCKDMNETLRRRGILYQVSEGLGFRLCILGILANLVINPSQSFSLVDVLSIAITLAALIVGILFFKSVKDGAIALLEQGDR